MTHHHITRQEAVRIVSISTVMLIAAEALACFHYLRQRDIAGAAIIVTSWGKDFIPKVITQLTQL